MLPDLFRHERHEGMQQPQRAVQHRAQDLRRALGLRGVAQLDLGDLQIPVAVLRPDEVVDLPPRLAELVLVDQPRGLDGERAARG